MGFIKRASPRRPQGLEAHTQQAAAFQKCSHHARLAASLVSGIRCSVFAPKTASQFLLHLATDCTTRKEPESLHSHVVSGKHLARWLSEGGATGRWQGTWKLSTHQLSAQTCLGPLCYPEGLLMTVPCQITQQWSHCFNCLGRQSPSVDLV